MMFYACGLFRREDIASRCVKEGMGRCALERRRVRHVDHDVRAREGFRESFAGHRVDAGGRCAHDHLMAALTQVVDGFRPNEA